MKIPKDDFQSTFTKPSSTIKEVIETLNFTGIKLVLVVDDQKHLLGTISDGDLRRGLIRGVTLLDTADMVMNIKPLAVKHGILRREILSLMEKSKVNQIPIVDSSNRVIGIHLWDEFGINSNSSNVMVIMAGGKGARLQPHTDKFPKPMLNVGGRPILEHIISRAKNQGFNQFILAINYLGEQIKEYFRDGKNFNVSIEYIQEEIPLGTAGALSLIKKKIEKSFIVTNGDVITDINYADLLDFHNANKASATVAAHRHEFQVPYGVIQVEGLQIVSYEEKPVIRNLINAGVYALDPKLLGFVKEVTFRTMPEVLELASRLKEKVIVYPLHEAWIDIGRPSDLELANRLVL